ncbi:hypothetical protein RFI_26787, partial [Reticulomyxa filosa]
NVLFYELSYYNSGVSYDPYITTTLWKRVKKCLDVENMTQKMLLVWFKIDATSSLSLQCFSNRSTRAQIALFALLINLHLFPCLILLSSSLPLAFSAHLCSHFYSIDASKNIGNFFLQEVETTFFIKKFLKLLREHSKKTFNTDNRHICTKKKNLRVILKKSNIVQHIKKTQLETMLQASPESHLDPIKSNIN